MVAIDFSLRNDSQSLHKLDPTNRAFRNAYQLAINAVCQVLAPYDTDKLFPVFGLGLGAGAGAAGYTPLFEGRGAVGVEGINKVMSLPCLLIKSSLPCMEMCCGDIGHK